MNTTIEIKTNDPVAKELLKGAMKWLERIANRKDELPKSFMDGCDPAVLAKDIRDYLSNKKECIHRAVCTWQNHENAGETPVEKTFWGELNWLWCRKFCKWSNESNASTNAKVTNPDPTKL